MEDHEDLKALLREWEAVLTREGMPAELPELDVEVIHEAEGDRPEGLVVGVDMDGHHEDDEDD